MEKGGTAVPLSEYVQVPGKYVAPIPRNSITIIRDVSLQLCAAKCTLAFRMKTFPCYAFEYTPGSRMCVHTNVTSLVINGGFLGLKDNKAVDYYERTKTSYTNLFQSHDHAALKQQNTYFKISLNKTLEECAYECLSTAVHTCMSFSHSPSTGACGLSNVFYGEGHEAIRLIQSRIYNHYQYYTSWPCNVTIPENYGPRAIASLHFPYQSIRHAQCHIKIRAPSGKQVQILFPTVFFGQEVCNKQNGVGLTIHDGNSASGSILGHYCQSTTNRSHPPYVTSTSGSIYVTYKANEVPLAFESIYQFVTVDPCESSQCKNSATCIAKNTSYVCECPTGFIGQFCEVNVDDCASSPCLFQGQCIDQINSYTCNCTHEFTGERCEKFIGECADNPCHQGICVVTSRYNYTCNCLNGYVGRHCDMKFTPCMSSPCQHGTCGETPDNYICKCSAGYTGRNCDRPSVDLCTPSPCKHGRCISTANSDVTCTCDSGFTGNLCETRIDVCASVNCNNGSCVRNEIGYSCQCHAGFKGQFCDTTMAVCEHHKEDCYPGTCYPYANVPEAYICWCPDNKYHRQCNNTFDACLPSPCHYGTCNRSDNGYTCICADGYIGSLSDRPRTGRLRVATQTQDRFIQVTHLRNRTQSTTKTAIIGRRSTVFLGTVQRRPREHDINFQRPYVGPILTQSHRQQRLQWARHHQRRRLVDWREFSFQTSLDSFFSHADGRLHVRRRRNEWRASRYHQRIPLHVYHQRVTEVMYIIRPYVIPLFAAQPQLQFYQQDNASSHCNISTCAVADCGLGLCEDNASGYNCICPVGYGGKNCGSTTTTSLTNITQSTMTACLTSPCHNNATCIERNLGFTCSCSEGWTGSVCDTIIDACSSSPCINSLCIAKGSKYR
ncbi:fibropellin-1-like [Ylistrum balloti]|uniref:fibropellin-1-like n=1 Tax=Ylistrum balloti TaxID=509963 RepID=UPI002905F592|nr:fibropellin-1-like [Ylistrum balloti]